MSRAARAVESKAMEAVVRIGVAVCAVELVLCLAPLQFTFFTDEVRLGRGRSSGAARDRGGGTGPCRALVAAPGCWWQLCYTIFAMGVGEQIGAEQSNQPDRAEQPARRILAGNSGCLRQMFPEQRLSRELEGAGLRLSTKQVHTTRSNVSLIWGYITSY
jgi:hypothetical protein